MPSSNNRRNFLRTATLAGLGLGLTRNTAAGTAAVPHSSTSADTVLTPMIAEGRVGMIGLDTSHSTEFTKILADPNSPASKAGYRVVAAYPYGTRTIASSAKRIPEIIEEVKKMGVEIVDSIETLLSKVDVVLLETNDGRLHLEQALQVIKAGKTLFIDKPISASLADAVAIFDAAKKYNVPVFSSSSLRYDPAVQNILDGKIGKIIGADIYAPCKLEVTHPDLFWYGIHGVETLFTIMGTGCKKVTRTNTAGTDMVVGTWDNNRIGSFRGLRDGKIDYGGSIFGEKGIATIPELAGYEPLLEQVVQFFKTGKAPVTPEETLEIFAFMEAADESKKKGGVPVKLADMFKKAKKKSS